jgi:hypothetical protein
MVFKMVGLNINQLKEVEFKGACSTHREKRYAYKILVRKLQAKRPL